MFTQKNRVFNHATVYSDVIKGYLLVNLFWWWSRRESVQYYCG